MIMFYVTHPSKEVAQQISQKLLEEKLVACSQIFPIDSSFWWEGAIDSGDEFVSVFKTSYKNAPHVEQMIEEIHPYEVPCILRWEFMCNIAYEKWLRSSIVER